MDWKQFYKDYSYNCDYQPMLDSFGKIIIQKDVGGYQGDTFVLYAIEDKFGVLVFGWGSCSGCDALQACATMQEIVDLYDALQASIHVFDDGDSVIEYLSGREMDWYSDYQEFSEFVEEVKRYFKAQHDCSI